MAKSPTPSWLLMAPGAWLMLGLALTFALIIAALPFLMLQWGFSGADIRGGRLAAVHAQ